MDEYAYKAAPQMITLAESAAPRWGGKELWSYPRWRWDLQYVFEPRPASFFRRAAWWLKSWRLRLLFRRRVIAAAEIPIPPYGSNRVTGDLIWYHDFTGIRHASRDRAR